ncbi:MAG: DUF2179 domain-containing protein [Bacteroidales bacterium]|jgi:uncharacterized protein YebE (UPF0316 family)|nr:DUF2179 domain-containing protein [Bacteroidales bacterium]
MEVAFLDSNWFIYGLLPLLIFLSRIVDVTLDTLRIVFISRGNKVIAPILGFFEILIWLVAITRIMENLDNLTTYFAYAAGFAVGNYVGLRVEEKLAMGMQIIRIITGRNASELIESLREKGFGVTAVDAEGKEGPVHVIFLITKRQVAKEVISIVNNYNPKAFYSIEDVRSVNLENSAYMSGATKSGSPRWMRKAR